MFKCPCNHFAKALYVTALLLSKTLALIPVVCPKFLAASATRLAVARYGPPSTSFPPSPSNPNPSSEGNVGDGSASRDPKDVARKAEFRALIDRCLAAKDPNHLPQLFANHVPLLASLHETDGLSVINQVLQDVHPNDQDRAIVIIDAMLSFAEAFVEQAEAMDDNNKRLLGKIIRAMSDRDHVGYDDREDRLDALMGSERGLLSAGFLRHLEGECHRIANAPRMTRESTRLLETLRIIRARVIEEAGKSLGEGAQVLGQLMGYDDSNELIAVLDAGLVVRGIDFAREMKRLTEEASIGLQGVPGGADVELVDRVALVDKRLAEFIDENDQFQ